MRTINYVTSAEYEGRKIFHYLKYSVGMSTALIRRLKTLSDGILLNGKPAKTIELLNIGDIVTVNIPDDTSFIEKSEIEPDIVYIDDDIAVVNKPAGLAMHPTHNHQGDTLANGMAWYFSKQGRAFTFRAAGRLDKCTSGLVVLCLNPLSASKLNANIKKTYYAIVGGLLEGSGTIDKRIYRPDPGKTLRAAGDEGDIAITHWQALKHDECRTLVKINLETGRTHQIRVHFSSIGMPLVGDEMYGSTDTLTSRAALHCGKVEFIHPVTNEVLKFTSLLPEDMNNIAKNML